MQPIIGICGRMGAGKDTLAAEILRRHPRYALWKFADTLRQATSIVAGVDARSTVTAEDKARDLSRLELTASEFRSRLVKAIYCVTSGTSYHEATKCELQADRMFEILTGERIAECGEHHHISLPMTVGRLLQLLGTECFRQCVGENIWVEALFARWAKAGMPPIVIADVRFPNEATAVRQRAGVVLLVRRAEAKRVDGRSSEHASERSLANEKPDFILENDGTILDLNRAIAKLWPRVSTLGQLRTKAECFGERAEWLFELLTSEHSAAVQGMLGAIITQLQTELEEAGGAYLGPALLPADGTA
jgi:hypothetical protein